MITEKEAARRISVIDHIDGELATSASVGYYNRKSIKENYDRKANILQTYYDFEMRKIDPENKLRYRSYTDYIFIKDEIVFAEIHDAFEYAKANFSAGDCDQTKRLTEEI